MATTSTVPTVKARLVTLLTAALATSGPTGGQVQVSYAWKGSAMEEEAVFLGRRPSDVATEPLYQAVGNGGIATLKAGRKQRNEDYPVELTIWTFRPDLTPADSATADARAFALLAEVEDVLADDPKLGLGTAVISTELTSFEHSLFPFNHGWCAVIVPTIQVRARLS